MHPGLNHSRQETMTLILTLIQVTFPLNCESEFLFRIEPAELNWFTVNNLRLFKSLGTWTKERWN